MEEYVCITVRSLPGEEKDKFAARLTLFWTHMLRNFQIEFEDVYAESSEFEERADCWTRQYLALEPVLDLLEDQMRTANVDYDPIDRDETYSKYEAVAPDWMQIEH